MKMFTTRRFVYLRRRIPCAKFASTSSVQPKFVAIDVGERVLRLETGNLAKMADGCVLGSIDDTSVLVTAVCKAKTSGSGFTPLTVDYRHKASAAGRIPTNFLRRELGATDFEILTSRMIDRSIRPLFAKGFSHDVQVTCNVMAVDGVSDPDVVAINSASAALAVSDIPWKGPVAAVRLGFLDGRCIVNPSRRQLQKSKLNAILAAASSKRVIMLDVSAFSLPVSQFLESVEIGLQETEKIIQRLLELKSTFGKDPRSTLDKLIIPEKEYVDAALLLAETRLKEIFENTEHTKLSRDNATSELRKEIVASLKESYQTANATATVDSSVLEEAFTVATRTVFRKLTFETGKRCDGRSHWELRPISCQVDLFKPLHGSALFQRGHTQVLCTVTLDSLEAAFKNDAISVLLGADKEKTFMLNYQFPPFANNEIGSGRPGRRELGHGALAEKALRCLIPADFAFTTRLTCDVLESNGSSSMASVCAGSLALMDAGVRIAEPAAGVAIGLLTQVNSEDPTKIDDYRLLTDISGLEDYIGDMDFKVAGTRTGLTAVQLDVKLQSGLTFKMLKEALERAHDARADIIDIMCQQGLREPRSKFKENGPTSEEFIVPVTKRSRLMGPGGFNVRKLESDLGVQFSQLDEQTYKIFAANSSALVEAKENIEKWLTTDPMTEMTLEFGAVYTTRIVEISNNGVMVTVTPNSAPIFIPNSQLDIRNVKHASALDLKVGDSLIAKYFGRDPGTGAIRLSRKALQAATPKIKRDKSEEQPVSSPWINKIGE